jgi:hypothetical protein
MRALPEVPDFHGANVRPVVILTMPVNNFPDMTAIESVLSNLPAYCPGRRLLDVTTFLQGGLKILEKDIVHLPSLTILSR